MNAYHKIVFRKSRSHVISNESDDENNIIRNESSVAFYS